LQEITILQAIKTKDKSQIPESRNYHDWGNMYFPDASFIPFIRQTDHLVKEIIRKKKEEDGGEIIKVCAKIIGITHTHYAHTHYAHTLHTHMHIPH